MKQLLLVLGLLAASAPARADGPDPALPGVPDASVGVGGADHSSEENDSTQQPCLDSSQCDLRTTCSNGRCVPTPVRNAAGCGGGALGALSLSTSFGLALTVALRRRTRSAQGAMR